MLKFHRQVADLNEQGEVRDLRESRSTHVNTFAIRKTLFVQIGGYPREYIGYGSDGRFREKYQRLVNQGHALPIEVAETIYVVTERKWFHRLERRPGSDSLERIGSKDGQAKDFVKGREPTKIRSAPPELKGDWRSFRLEHWKADRSHRFLERNVILENHWRRLHKLLPEYLTPDRRRRFLDVGCGNGAAMEILRHLGHDAEGLDYTPGISDADETDWLYRPLIESQQLKCTVHDGAAVPYPFPDDRFDVVMCYGVITCIKPCSLWPQLLNEFARLARSCILLGVNVGARYDRGRAFLEEWRHPEFELTHREGAIYKWRRKRRGAGSAAPRRREDSRARLPLVFSGSRVRPVDL